MMILNFPIKNESWTPVMNFSHNSKSNEAKSYFDGIRENCLVGWAYLPDYPDRKLVITFFVDGRQIGSTRADLYRVDLAESGHVDGRVAYQYRIPPALQDGGGHRVSVAWSADLPDTTASGWLVETPEHLAFPERSAELHGLVWRNSTAPGAPDRAASRYIPVASARSAISAMGSRPPVVIIVRARHSAVSLRTCCEALVAHTLIPSRLWVALDADASPEMDLCASELEHIARSVSVLRNDPADENRSRLDDLITSGQQDVVVIDDSTIVGPNWLARLCAAAASAQDIGLVVPLSKTQSWCDTTPLVSSIASWRRLARCSHRLHPTAPAFGATCLYLRPSLLAETPTLDTLTGRGLEDLAQVVHWDLLTHGFRTVLCDDVLVYDRAPRESARSLGNITQTALVRDFAESDATTTIARALASALDNPIDDRPRVMFVISRPDHSGTPLISMCLARTISDNFDPLFLWFDDSLIVISQLKRDGELQERTTYKLNRGINAHDLFREDIDTAIYDALLEFDIDIIHCRQLVKTGFSIPKIAKTLGVSVVLSFHDYYLICPTVFLLDGENRFCGGSCAEGRGECRSFFVDPRIELRNAWTKEWQVLVQSMFKSIDAFVATTKSSLDVISQVYPALRSQRVHVIEHGRDASPAATVAAAPRPGEQVRLLALGNYSEAKGFGCVLRLMQRAWANPVELHWLGATSGVDHLPQIGTYHGSYEPSTVVARIREIAPHFVLLLSPWGETYSHTLTEAWAAGVPVVGTDFGALGERISATGAGWTVDPHDDAKVRAVIERAIRDRDEYQRVTENVRNVAFRSARAMADDYEALYESVLKSRTTLN